MRNLLIALIIASLCVPALGSRGFTREATLEISRGAISTQSHVNKFGQNTAVAGGSTEEIWDGSAVYVFPATALMTSMSQTTDQVAMRGATIELQGLDASWNAVTQTKALDASDTTTVITLDTAMIRCFRMKVLADVVGDSQIRCHNAGETQDYAIIDTGNNQTLMAIYTVPNGKTAYLTCYYAHHHPASGVSPTSLPIRFWASDRDNSYAKQIKHVVGMAAERGFQHFFNPYVEFTQKTDVYITVAPISAQPVNISAGFDLILVDN